MSSTDDDPIHVRPPGSPQRRRAGVGAYPCAPTPAARSSLAVPIWAQRKVRSEMAKLPDGEHSVPRLAKATGMSAALVRRALAAER